MLICSILYLVTSSALLTALQGAAIETTISKAKSNFFDPVLSASAFTGHLKENERIVQLEPPLFATDADLSTSPNGQICGYELSKHKHDDLPFDQQDETIPFVIDLEDGEARLKLKSNINQLDCEVQQSYGLFLRAYDCAAENNRRYSERSALNVIIDDVNEFTPVFTHENYLFKLHQDQPCSACRVEATDDDCANIEHRVCDYRITTPNVPFSIDANGSIAIVRALNEEKYEFDVIAIDCYSATSAEENVPKISEPARVTVKIIKACKPMITDNHPTKLTIQSDHTHVFDTVHVDTCDETCAVEDIVGVVQLSTNGLNSGCDAEQCTATDREYVLMSKDLDSDSQEHSHATFFNGPQQATIVPKSSFSGQFQNDFIIRLSMKHSNDSGEEKEHIFCNSDEKVKNRHHLALYVQNDRLKLLIRKGPVASNEKTMYPSEWTWRLAQINDGQWHSYKIFVNYPNQMDLYVDDKLIIPSDADLNIVEAYPLPSIEGTDGTVLALGACWHGRAAMMAQYFRGQLSGLSIEQKEESDRSAACIRDCQEYLEMPDVPNEASVECTSNNNRSIWVLRTDSTESFEQLLKHLVYRNTFDPLGPSGQRTISIQSTVRCLGENYTYNLPVFTRRLAIDESPHPVDIELKGDKTFLVTEEALSKGIYLFQNISIYADALSKSEADITDCSIGTLPEFSSGEQLIVPDENLDINNLAKVPTQTGLILSGAGSIDSYQYILQQISYRSRSPVKYLDRTFSLVCIGANDQSSTNEIRIEIHVEKQVAPPAPVAAVQSDKLFVDNDLMRDNAFDVDGFSRPTKNITGWPIAIVVCASVGLAGVLVLYLVVRIRSGHRQRRPLNSTGDDAHSQMEWEDDIGLNIIVNPLDETKKSAPTKKLRDTEQRVAEYDGTTSEDEEYDGRNYDEYSSGEEHDEDNDDDIDDDDDEDEEEELAECRQVSSRKHDHQLEWDDAGVEYGPKKV